MRTAFVPKGVIVERSVKGKGGMDSTRTADQASLSSDHSDDQYNQIDYLMSKLRNVGLVKNLQGRETGRRKRVRTMDGELGFREMTRPPNSRSDSTVTTLQQ